MSYQLDRTLQLIEEKEALKAEVARLTNACAKEFRSVEYLDNRNQFLQAVISKLMNKARSTLCSSQFDELDEYLETLMENK